MATSNTVSLFNTDPNVQAQAALLQRQQAMAQALLDQGMKPLDTAGRQVGGVGYNISPMEGLAKMLQAYSGRKGLEDTTQQQAGLASQAYGALLDKYQPGTDPSFSPSQIQGAESAGMPGQGTDGMGPPDPQKMAAALMGQQPAQGGQNPNNPLGMPASLVAGRVAGLVPDDVYASQAALYKPTDATLQARQGGMDPMAANRAVFDKANTDPEILAMRQARLPEDLIQRAVYAKMAKASDIERRPGQSFQNNFTGQSGITPTIPPNSNPVGVPGPNGAIPGVTPIPGAQPVVQGTAEAGSTGTANGSIHPVTLPNGAVVPARGREIPPLAASQDADRVAIYRQEVQQAQQRLATAQTPQDKARAQGDLDALQRETQRLGIKLGQSTSDQVGVTDQMKDMTERFGKLRTQSSEAQNTISYLQSIKQEAGRASTGQFADRIQFVNSMLAPFSEKAYDAASAKQLLDKYSNQIVARLGQGGLGTDAARSILQSAYPNSHMTQQAINEAADNLIGAQNMTMAKTQLLAPLHNARNTAAYQQTEQRFDQLADPRIWQLRDMDANTAKSFLSRLPARVQQDLRQRAVELQKMGAL